MSPRGCLQISQEKVAANMFQQLRQKGMYLMVVCQQFPPFLWPSKKYCMQDLSHSLLPPSCTCDMHVMDIMQQVGSRQVAPCNALILFLFQLPNSNSHSPLLHLVQVTQRKRITGSPSCSVHLTLFVHKSQFILIIFENS